MKILRRKVQGATYLPKNPYDKGPEDKKGPNEESVSDKFQITFDTLIDIDDDGDWSPVDEDFKFLESPDSEDGNWYSEEYPSAMVADMDAIIDAFDQVVTPEIDAEPHKAGRYSISGTVYLAFDSDIEYEYEESEDDYASDWKSKVDVINVDSEFNLKNSDLTNFKIAADVSSATKVGKDTLVTRDVIYAGDEPEDDSPLKHEQKYTSKNTAVNWKYGKLPALFKKVNYPSGAMVLDYGGGTEQSAALAQAFFDNTYPDVDYVYYDKYWQPKDEQRAAEAHVKQNGGADIVLLSNVLNVIAEPEVRNDILVHIKQLLKPGGTLYIYGYEGQAKDRGKGGRETAPDQYQTFMETKSYMDEIHQVFPDAKYKGGMIIAPNTDVPTL